MAELKEGHGLTEKQHEFARRLVEGFCQTEAARLAGYSAPDVEAVRLVRHPKILNYIRKLRQARIDGELAGLALSTLKDLLTDKETPAETRRKAAKDVLEMAGHGQNSQSSAGELPDKPLSEYTAEDFEKAIQRAEQQAARLRDVTNGSTQTIEGSAQVIEE